MITKHNSIFEEVKEQIVNGRLRSGEQLPTQAELSRKHSVAMGTVRVALTRLQREGLVSSYRGKGSFVLPRGEALMREASPSNIGLVFFNNDGRDYLLHDHLSSIHDVMAQADRSLMVGAFRVTQIDEAMAWTRQMAGVLAWAYVPQEYMQRLVEEQIPAVMLGNCLECACPDELGHVEFDLEAAVDQAIQHLGNMGHRRILLVNRDHSEVERSTRFYQELSESFAACVKARIDQPEADVLVASGNDGGISDLIDYLESSDPIPTALLVEGSTRACSMLHELQLAGWQAPERISVMGLSSTGLAHLVLPRLTFVEMPMEPLARRSSHAILDSLSKQIVVRESVSPKLHWGHTCQAIGESVLK